MQKWSYFLLLTQCFGLSQELFESKNDLKKFPRNFMFGTVSSAYQTEGAWNSDGKGENIWDHYTHKHPYHTLDGSNANVACDSYTKFKEDVLILKDLGVDFYRFSLSWSRILPTGFANKVNPNGIRHYNELIDLLLENNISPMVTIFHWDTPQPIEDLGGFSSALVVEWFEEYARVVFENFGKKVKYWITFNNPKEMCLSGYGMAKGAPGYNSSGIGDYMCAHNILKSHAKVYHLYNNTFKATQKGRVSIAIDGTWYESATNSPTDVEAARRALDFDLSWFADPIYHSNGDHPICMKKYIAERSRAEGFSRSRLPEFTTQEVENIKGTYDYFALNHYTTRLAASKTYVLDDDPLYIKDLGVAFQYKFSSKQNPSEMFNVAPWGFRKILSWIKTRYGNPEVIITENGFQDHGEIDDQNRINFFKLYLSAMLEAIYEDQVKVIGYTVRSLLDSFEWSDGYVTKYGLYHVNFSDPNRTRTPKTSSVFYKKLIKKHRSENAGEKPIHSKLLLIIIFQSIFFSIKMIA